MVRAFCSLTFPHCPFLAQLVKFGGELHAQTVSSESKASARRLSPPLFDPLFTPPTRSALLFWSMATCIAHPEQPTLYTLMTPALRIVGGMELRASCTGMQSVHQQLLVVAFPASVDDCVRRAGGVERMLQMQAMGQYFSANDKPNQWWDKVMFSALPDGAADPPAPPEVHAPRVTHLSFRRYLEKDTIKAKATADAAYAAEATAMEEEAAAKAAAAKAAAVAAAEDAAAKDAAKAAEAAEAAEAAAKGAGQKRGRAASAPASVAAPGAEDPVQPLHPAPARASQRIRKRE